MSHGNSARLKHPKKGETLDLDDQNETKGISRSQHGNVDLQLSHLDSNLALDLNPDLGLGLLQKHANFADVMNRYGYNSINEFDDLKAVTRKEYPPRSHPTDGGDDEMAHRLGGRLESRRSLSTVRDLSAGNDEKGSWVNDCEFLETNQRQKYAHVDNILNVPLPDLVSYSGGNNMSTWSNRKSRLKPAKSPEETFQLDDLDEEPDCQTEESNDRQSRSTNVALRPSLKMRPRSEPPHLRLPGNEQNFLEHYQGSDKLKSQLWHIQVPEETAYGIESRISRPSCDVSPPVCPSWEGSQRKGKTSERKKRKLSPKDKKVEKKEIKTKVVSDKINRLKLSKNNRTQPRRKKSFSPPSLQRYSPPTKDNTPFKRTSKTFPEMRAINQVINEDMQEKKKAEEGDTTKPMDSPPPCYKSYSPSSSKKNLSSRRSPSPRQSVKKTENPKSSSPQRNMPKRNQLTPTKIPPSDIKAEGDVSSTMCYPSYSPSYYNTSRRSPSKTSVKALRRSNDEGKTQTKQQSPSSRPKSPKKGKTQSLKSASKENCVASPCARSRSRQASPASSKTHFLSKCSPPFRSTSKIYPDPKLKRSPSLSKTASKTSVKPVSPGVKREPSWGSLAITAMPLQPSFLPTFYEDLRASPPSPRINSTSPSQFCTDGSALWQHGYPKTESPSPKRNSDKRGTFSNEGVVPSTSGLHQKSPPRHARTNSGMHKTGKRGKRSRKDKNENKRHKAKKRSSKVDAGDLKADSRGETCTPSYHPCRESPEFVSKADKSPPKSNEVTPGKGQTAAVSRPSRSRLGALCRKSSPKGKLNLRWPSPCHRRCGQSMPRLGVLTRIGQAFGSQLRTIANNRFPFPGITPLYVSDAGPEEWFRYPDTQETGGSRAASRAPSARPEMKAAGVSSTAEEDESQALAESDMDAGGDPQSENEVVNSDGQSGSDTVEKHKGDLQEAEEGQCYRMRATVRSNKDVVEVNLEECNGVVCRSRKAFHDQRSDGHRRSRVGRRRSASRDSEGGSRGLRHDRRGGSGGKGSHRKSSLKSSRSKTRSPGEKDGQGSSRSSPRAQSPSLKRGESGSKPGDSERSKRSRKRGASLSSSEDDSSKHEGKSKTKKKIDRHKYSDKKKKKSSAKVKNYRRSPDCHKKLSSVTESSDVYSTSKEVLDDSSQAYDPDRKAKGKRVIVSSDTERNLKVRCMSGDSDQDQESKLVSTCRRRYRGGTGNDMKCQRFTCGKDSSVEVCATSPNGVNRGRRRRGEEDSSAYDVSANHSESNIHAPDRYRRSATRQIHLSPRQHVSSSQLSSERLPLDSRNAHTKSSPSDSFVLRKISYEKERESSHGNTGSSSGSQVDPSPSKRNRQSSPNKRYYAGDDKSLEKLETTTESNSYIRTAVNQSRFAPIYMQDGDNNRGSFEGFNSRYDRENHLAKIKGRMKFLSVNEETKSGNTTCMLSRSTSVGIKNGTVKMAASPRDVKIIRCDPDDAYERSSGEGVYASLRTSVESFALDEEDFFVSRPNPDKTSIARYERDSRYIKMRQLRLERLERSMNVSDTETSGFVPKSQYLNRVSRRKRSHGQDISPDGVTSTVLSRCVQSEASVGDNEVQNKRQTHESIPQGIVKHPELLDQFSRIITPEQALRLAEARSVVTTDSDASGLLPNMHKQPLIHHINSSQNNDGNSQPADQMKTKAESKVGGKAHVVKSQGGGRDISDDYFITPPSRNCEDSFESHRYKRKAKNQCGSRSEAIVPFNYQSNNSSGLPTIYIKHNIEEEGSAPRSKIYNDMNFCRKTEIFNTENLKGSLKSVCAVLNEFGKPFNDFKSCIPVGRLESQDNPSSLFPKRNPIPSDFISKKNWKCNDIGLDHSDINQHWNESDLLEEHKFEKNPERKQSLYSPECSTHDVEISPNKSSPAHEMEKEVNRLTSHLDIQTRAAKHSVTEQIPTSAVLGLTSLYPGRMQQEQQDKNQSSNTDGDQRTSAADPGEDGDDAYEIGTIDNLRLSHNENPPPSQTVTFLRDIVPSESSTSFNTSSNHCSPPVRQCSHLGAPLRRSHSSRLAASVPKPKKYFAESESDWSVSSDDDHLIQMAKSLPAIFPYRPDEDRVLKNIRRNSLCALIYASSISNLPGHQRPRSFEKGDGPNRSKREMQVATEFLKGLQHSQLPNRKITPHRKGFNNNKDTDALRLRQQMSDLVEANCSEKNFQSGEVTKIADSHYKEPVDSYTSCHTLPSLPCQIQSTLVNACKQILSVLKLTRKSPSQENSRLPVHESHEPSVKQTNNDPDGQIANQAYIQKVVGPNDSDLIKLRTEDGHEFWILSADTIEKLNALPLLENGHLSNSKENACNNHDVRESSNGFKQSLVLSNLVDESKNSHGRTKEHSTEEEPSPPVFDDEIYNDENQNKIPRDMCSQINDSESSYRCEVGAASNVNRPVSRPKSDPDSYGLRSASQPCYFLKPEDFLQISGVDRAVSCRHPDMYTAVGSPTPSKSVEEKSKAEETNIETKLIKSTKRSKKKTEKCLCSANTKASHISRTEPVPKLDHTPNISEDSSQQVKEKDPKSSSVDPCVLKLRKKKKNCYSSVDPPWFDRESSTFTDDKSYDGHCREIPKDERNFERRDRGDQVGTDLDQAIRDHLNMCRALEGNETMQDSSACKTKYVMKTNNQSPSTKPSLGVDASNCTIRSPSKKYQRSLAGISKSTQANDTLSLVSSATLTSEEETGSPTDTIFDKPSVVVVSLSSKGHSSPIRAMDKAMHKGHQDILLEWLKNVVPDSLLSSGMGKESESTREKEVIEKKRGHSEPRKSRKRETGSRIRVASVGRADRFQDNSSNALTTTDLSVEDASLCPYLKSISCQSDVCSEKGKRHRNRRECSGGEDVDSTGYPSSKYAVGQTECTAREMGNSASPLSPTHTGWEQAEKKKRSKISHGKTKDASAERALSTQKTRKGKTKAEEKSRHASSTNSSQDRGACAHCGKPDFSLNSTKELHAGKESGTTQERDKSASNTICAVDSSSTETASFYSAEDINLGNLRKRFDKLVADLDTVYQRDGDGQPQTSYSKPYDVLLELSKRDSFRNVSSRYNAATPAERETLAPIPRRKELSIPFNSDFLREFKFDAVPEFISREDDLMKQYSYGLPERRFSGYNNSSSRVSSDFSGVFRHRRNSLTGNFHMQFIRSPSFDPGMDLYSTGSSAGVSKFASGHAFSWVDITNNRPTFERSPGIGVFSGNNENVFGEKFRLPSFSNNGDMCTIIDDETQTNRETMMNNWNENSNTRGQDGQDDISSSSKSSTDEDFLEFEAEGGGGEAGISDSVSGMITNTADINSGTLTNVPCKSTLITMGKEMKLEARSAFMDKAVPREHFLGLLSGTIPETQCLCSGCGCRSNNYQSGRKHDIFTRMHPVAIRNINGSGNLSGKESYTKANTGTACKGLDTDTSSKDTSGGNNRASDEEFVSAIEHLSSTMRHCENLVPRYMWQDCQEMDDTCNHWQDSGFYIGNGPVGCLPSFRRVTRDDCYMHIDDDHTGISKLYNGPHCGSDGILPEALATKPDRGQPWGVGAASSIAASSLQQAVGVQAHYCNVGLHACRGQAGRSQRNGMAQWYQDTSKSLDSLSAITKLKSCNNSETFIGAVQEKESKYGYLPSEYAGKNCECKEHGEIDDEEDDDDDEDDVADFEEVVEEEEDEDEPDESDEDEEDDDADDVEEEAIDDENHNREIVRQRIPRNLCQRDEGLDTLHAKKDFSEAGKQGGDINAESKVATITNGRFNTGDTAACQERLGDYGSGEGKVERKYSDASLRNSLRQKKFSLDQIKVPAIEKERVRFACDESGDWAEIGRGSYGCVYLGLLDGSIEVAIKDFYEASSWELVIHEARMLMFLQDTGITPRLYGLRRRFDVSKQPSEYCIIMEYFGDGRTLFNVMSDKIPLRTDEWLDIVGQLVAGLRLIHRKGVLINDLKADNILVDLTKGRKVIRYIDVGMATYRQGLTFQLPEDQMNRYNFLAPEVREGGRTTTRSDIYSLGYMLEQMCRLADSALGGLRKLVSRCMDKRASKRPDLDDIVSQVHRFIGAKASRSVASASPRVHPLLNNSV